MRKILKNYRGVKYIIPSLTGFLILYLIPLFLVLKYSFQKSSFNTSFVGFDNYINIVHNKSFCLAMNNTIKFVIIAIPLIIVLSFLLALTVYETKPPKFVSLFIILPMVIPSGSIAGFFKEAFGSGTNNILETKYAMIIVVFLYIWRNTGYNFIIYLASFSKIDRGIIEASEIDGISYLGKIKHIFIPLTAPGTAFVGILSIINSFKIFKDIFIIQGEYPNPSIYMMQHFLNNKFNFLKYEELTTAANIFTLMTLILVFIFLRIDRNYARKVGRLK